MRLRSLLLVGAVALSTTTANAQNWVQDSVEMGTGYANDAFYSLKNGSAKVEPNTNWHLAFQMTPPGPYGNVSVIANQVQGGVNVYSLHMAASTNFATLSAGDTVGKTGPARQLFNSDSTWNLGAFNRLSDPSDLNDYSWGYYDQQDHDVNGDSLYLITITSGSTTEAYKVWIQRFMSYPLDSIHWEFRIAKFDGSNDNTVKIYRKPAYTDRLFAYYNVNTNTELDREPGRAAWDVLFTRYKEYLAGAPGVPYYSVMGLLSNFDVAVAEKHNVAADDTANFAGFAYSGRLNQIGSDWKVFDMSQNPPAYVIDDSTYYFVKTKNTNEYYQLQFTGFGGTADGKVFFRKRYLGVYNPLGISTVNSAINAHYLVPNPANSSASMLIDINEQVNSARLLIMDLSGRVVSHTAVKANSGLNEYRITTANLTDGMYMVVLTDGNWKVAEKLIVQH